MSARLAYPGIPARVRAWVEATLDSPVVSATEQVGGMSPGCATRLVCADGTRAFVKAVGPELNPDTPDLFRRERAVLALLGAHHLWAGLLAEYDEPDGWVALLIEDVDGNCPNLADDSTMNTLTAATDDLAAVLYARTPQDVSQAAPEARWLKPVNEQYRRWADAFDHLDRVPDDLVPGWVRRRAPTMQADLLALADQPMDSLVHWDIRDDNLLQRPDGSIVFIDWGQASLGPAWTDPLLARLERVEAPWFDDSVRRSPSLRAAGDDLITAWLCGFAVFLAYRMGTAVDVNLPGKQAYRRRESARLLRGAARRLGMP